MIIRPATSTDVAAVQAIYAHHVLNGVGTFEETPPTVQDMARRMADVSARGLPWLVAETAQAQVLGFAYASPFRLRAAYRYTAEDSIYLAPEATGRGIGRALLSKVIEACEAAGLRQMLAVIGGSDNAASIGVHRACGFEHVAITPAVGFKHGRFVDVVWMQKALNGGSDTLPDAPGLAL